MWISTKYKLPDLVLPFEEADFYMSDCLLLRGNDAFGEVATGRLVKSEEGELEWWLDGDSGPLDDLDLVTDWMPIPEE